MAIRKGIKQISSYIKITARWNIPKNFWLDRSLQRRRHHRFHHKNYYNRMQMDLAYTADSRVVDLL